MITIYALKDPDTDEIRYVGKSKNAVARHGAHIAAARSPQKCQLDNEAYRQWMTELNGRGAEPLMEIIDEVPRDEANEVEARYIAQYAKTHNLVNILPENRRQRKPRKQRQPVSQKTVDEYRRQAEWSAEFWATVRALRDEFGNEFLSKMTTEFVVLCRNYDNLTDAEKRRLTIIEAWHRALIAGPTVYHSNLRCEQ